MIEIFKTNVNKKEHANIIIQEIIVQIPNSTVSIDLEDCDRVLRIETENSFNSFAVIKLINGTGFLCEIMNE